MIEIEGLRKCFGAHPALDGLDLRVPAGSVFGFLGRHGAGKTTTIKHLLGLTKADGGSAGLAINPEGTEVCHRIDIEGNHMRAAEVPRTGILEFIGPQPLCSLPARSDTLLAGSMEGLSQRSGRIQPEVTNHAQKHQDAF